LAPSPRGKEVERENELRAAPEAAEVSVVFPTPDTSELGDAGSSAWRLLDRRRGGRTPTDTSGLAGWPHGGRVRGSAVAGGDPSEGPVPVVRPLRVVVLDEQGDAVDQDVDRQAGPQAGFDAVGGLLVEPNPDGEVGMGSGMLPSYGGAWGKARTNSVVSFEKGALGSGARYTTPSTNRRMRLNRAANGSTTPAMDAMWSNATWSRFGRKEKMTVT
jgi:hypothetical protein